MKIPNRLRYFFTLPPLWIIQLGNDELIFSHVTEQGITTQERLFLSPHTILLNKIANPSSFSLGLKLFCTQKKISKMRAWFLLPKELFPHDLLPHELFQLLLSMKKTPIIPEKIITSPLHSPALLTTSIVNSVHTLQNQLSMFAYYNPVHPAWWMFFSSFVIFIFINISMFLYRKTEVPINLIKEKSHPIKLSTQSIQKKPQSSTITSLQNIKTILKSISNTIPATIVLKKLISTPHTQSSKEQSIKILGFTSSVADLTNFITDLEKALGKSCSLCKVLEKSSAAIADKQKFQIHQFSIIITI